MSHNGVKLFLVEYASIPSFSSIFHLLDMLKAFEVSKNKACKVETEGQKFPNFLTPLELSTQIRTDLIN